jgi:hypothetical protein
MNIVSLVVAAALVACVSDEPKPSPKQEPTRAPAPAAVPAAEPPVEAKPPAPEPTTPEEIDLARKTALLEGRDKDAFKYCGMAGVSADTSDEQVLLGCAIAACRIKQVDQARAWAQPLSKPLMQQAKQICKANGVPL